MIRGGGESERLELGFERAGVSVAVRAELWSNDDPAAYGCPEFARGFPVLRATIEPPGRGYQDLLGWIQLIHDPERSDDFLIDSLEMLSEVTHPFGYFGYAPVLFDAPHRIAEADMDWVAHTFLGSVGGIYGECDAHAYLGFSWGYRIRAGKPSLVGFEELGPDAWDAHLPFLRAQCPAWTFAPGYHTGMGEDTWGHGRFRGEASSHGRSAALAPRDSRPPGPGRDGGGPA